MLQPEGQDTASSEGMVRTCSIWRALEVVGDVPTLLILEAIWLGDLRFGAIVDRTGLSKPLISERLKKLVANGLLKRVPYCERPLRYEFRLERKGRDLFPVTMMLLRWEKMWSGHRENVAISLVHESCGKTCVPQLGCGHCGEVVAYRDIEWQEGPGLGWMKPDYTRRRQQRNRSELADTLTLFTDAAELLGDRWSSLIMRSAFTGLNRYDEMQADSAMATNILSERLAWLVERDFLKAKAYQQGPTRYSYHPTAKAYDYLPVLLMLQRWGDQYFASKDGPPVILRHKSCGALLSLVATCDQCGDELEQGSVSLKS